MTSTRLLFDIDGPIPMLVPIDEDIDLEEESSSRTPIDHSEIFSFEQVSTDDSSVKKELSSGIRH